MDTDEATVPRTAKTDDEPYRQTGRFQRYRIRKEMFAWILHRITGLALVLYLVLHVWGLRALTDPETFNAFIAHYHSPLVKGLEVLLLGAVIYHALNGLRVTLIDFLGWSPHQNKLYWLLGTIAIILFAVGAYPSLYVLGRYFFGG